MKKTKGQLIVPDEISSYVDKPRIIEVLSYIEGTRQEASKLIIFTDDDVAKAGDLLKRFSNVKKYIEYERTKAVKPLNGLVKAVNNYFKSLMSFEQDESRLRTELNQYLEQKRLAEALERKKEESDRENEEVFGIIDDKIIIKTKPLSDNLTTVRKKTWEVIDINQVPREYLVIDEKKINELRSQYDFEAESPIPGIKFTITETVRIN